MTTDFTCQWSVREGVAVLEFVGDMRSPEAVEQTIAAVMEIYADREATALVSDLRRVTRLASSRQVLQMTRRLASHPEAAKLHHRAIVVDSPRPLYTVLHRWVAAASTGFPARRLFVRDVDAAIRWAAGEPEPRDEAHPRT